MHRNTFVFVIFLAIFAALVAGVNIGKSMTSEYNDLAKNSISPSPTPSTTVSATQAHKYIHKECGVQLHYPANFTLNEEASASAVFVRSDAKDYIILTCQKDIPRPPIPKGSIDTIQVTNDTKTATVSAKLYHDTALEDGSKMDVFIYFNPRVQKDVFIAGYGADYNATVHTILLYP